MKQLNHRAALTTTFLLFLSALTPLRATVITWTGIEDGDVTKPGNWSGGTLVGDGNDDVAFGDSLRPGVIVPGAGVALRDITINGSVERPSYTFSGSGGTRTLGINGKLVVTTPGSGVLFDNTLNILLSSIPHVVDIHENVTVTVAGIVSASGSGSIYKQGAGTLVLSGANTFSGGVTVSEGTLLLGASSTLSGEEISNGPVGTGTLELQSDTTLGLASGANEIILHNPVRLLNNHDPGMTIDVGSERNLALQGVISGEGPLTKTGSGALILTGNNTFSGDFYISSGRVNFDHNNAAGQGALEFGSSGGSAHFSTTRPVIHGLESDTYSSIYLTAQKAILEIRQGTGTDTTYLGDIRADSPPDNDGRVLKTGTGTLRLDGNNDGGLYSYGFADVAEGPLVSLEVQQGTLVLANDYFLEGGTEGGTVRVSGGTLALHNSTLEQPLILQSGSTLAGNNGYIANATVGSGVTVAPGFGLSGSDAIGSLNFGDLTLGQGGVLEMHVRFSDGEFDFDQLDVQNPATLTISATTENPFTLKLISLNSDYELGTLADSGLTPGNTYTLAFLCTNGVDGDFILDSNLLVNASAFQTGAGSDTFGLVRTGNNFALTFTPVPEPSTYALMLAGLGAIALQLKRRRLRS